MQCVCGAVAAAAGWGRLQQQRPLPAHYYKQKTKVYKGSSAPAFNTLKYRPGAGCCASWKQCLRSAGKKANFGAVKICLFASKEHTKINDARGRKGYL